MTHVRFDYAKALPFFGEHEITYLQDAVKVAHHSLHEQTGAGSDFLGWIDLPANYDKEEFSRIQKAAEKLKAIPMFLSSLELEVPILERVRLLKCFSTVSIMHFQKKSAALRRYYLPATILVPLI